MVTTASETVQPPTGKDLTGLGRAEFIALMSMVTATIAMSIDTVLPAFDEIEADFGCEILEILAENGQAVEYGAKLFRVRKL